MSGSEFWLLMNGFYYRWEPTPPARWLDLRREYNAFLRSRLGSARTLPETETVALLRKGAKS